MSNLELGTVEDMLTTLNWKPQKKPEWIPAEQEFSRGAQTALIAPPKAGKTAVTAGLFHKAQEKVRETKGTDNPFFARMIEGGSDIHQDISNLMSGIFPAKTRSYLGFRSSPGMLLEQKKFAAVRLPILGARPRKQLWHKMLQMKVCDLPGETLNQVIYQIRRLNTDMQQTAKDVIEHALAEMLECEAFIFITKASEALGLGTQSDKPIDDTGNEDPDVPLTRMAEYIFNTKMRRGEKIKKIFVAITAWDKLAPAAQKLNINFLDPYVGEEHKEAFVAHCYPQFYACIHSYVRSEDIKYYALYFQTEKKDGKEIKYNDKVEYYNPDKKEYELMDVERPHIMLKRVGDPRNRSIWDGVRKAEWSRHAFGDLLDDLMGLAEAQ